MFVIYNIKDMELTYSILILVFGGILLGYFFGSLVWSVIIGKCFFKKDPRNFESKNAGATNSARIYGKKVALLILLLDISKAIIPTIVMWLIAKFCLSLDAYINESFNFYTLVYLSPLFSLVGHCYPLFFKFKGGKGASTFGAFLIMLFPLGSIFQLILLILLVTFSKYVSLSCLISSIISWFILFIPGINYNFVISQDINTEILLVNYGSIYWLLFIFAILFCATLILWWKHRSNIINLINKKERKFSFKK